MPATTTYGIRYPASTDAPDIVQIVKNTAEDVDGALKYPVAQLYATSSQSVPHNTFTAVNFGGETFDTHNGHSTTTNNSRWTCPSGWAGYYLVSGLVQWDNPANALCAAIYKNGTAVRGGANRIPSVVATHDGNTDTGVTTGSVEVLLAVGDYVQLLVEQNAGSARSTKVADPLFVSGLSVTFLRRV